MYTIYEAASIDVPEILTSFMRALNDAVVAGGKAQQEVEDSIESSMRTRIGLVNTE